MEKECIVFSVEEIDNDTGAHIDARLPQVIIPKEVFTQEFLTCGSEELDVGAIDFKDISAHRYKLYAMNEDKFDFKGPLDWGDD